MQGDPEVLAEMRLARGKRPSSLPQHALQQRVQLRLVPPVVEFAGVVHHLIHSLHSLLAAGQAATARSTRCTAAWNDWQPSEACMPPAATAPPLRQRVTASTRPLRQLGRSLPTSGSIAASIMAGSEKTSMGLNLLAYSNCGVASTNKKT